MFRVIRSLYMKNFQKMTALFGVIVILFGLHTPPSAAAKGDKLAVVVKADGALTGLGLKEIRAIYTGEKLYEGSNKIEPLVNGDEAVSGSFFKLVLAKNKAQYKKIWNSKAFVDAIAAPAVLPDSTDVLRAVNKSDGAIGFVMESDISAAQRKYVKVIYLAE